MTDRRLLPNGRPATQLARQAVGRLVIVFCGGPSAPAQWSEFASLRPFVISANGHAARAGVVADLIVCKDHRHSGTHEFMEDLLRPLGVPIVSPQWWADYRMIGFPSQGNSGQLALALGVLMGGHPVIPVGMDCYQGQATYFHDADAKNVSRGRHHSVWAHSMTRLAKRLEGGVVRVPRGPLEQAFPRFSPVERLPAASIPPTFAAYATQRCVWGRVVRTTPNGPPVNWVYPMGEREAELARRAGQIVDFPFTV